jgi:hypothetical protein
MYFLQNQREIWEKTGRGAEKATRERRFGNHKKRN